MDDTISRQAAIDAFDGVKVDAENCTEYDIGYNDGIDFAVSRLSVLPSAEPETAQNVSDEDLISRKAAIEKIESHTRVGDELYPLTDTDKILNHAFEIAASCVYNLPPAQPEQQWIPWNSGRFPKESGTYTVTAYDGATKRVTYAKYQKRLKRWELTGARAYWRVLAWMPLPEPYREVSETDG